MNERHQLLLAACISECANALTHLRATGEVDTPAGKRVYRLLRGEFSELVTQWPGTGSTSQVVDQARAYATARHQQLSELLNDKRVGT
jgi:hypothetical protein